MFRLCAGGVLVHEGFFQASGRYLVAAFSAIARVARHLASHEPRRSLLSASAVQVQSVCLCPVDGIVVAFLSTACLYAALRGPRAFSLYQYHAWQYTARPRSPSHSHNHSHAVKHTHTTESYIDIRTYASSNPSSKRGVQLFLYTSIDPISALKTSCLQFITRGKCFFRYHVADSNLWFSLLWQSSPDYRVTDPFHMY